MDLVQCSLFMRFPWFVTSLDHRTVVEEHNTRSLFLLVYISRVWVHIKIRTFRQQATSIQAGFHAGSLSWSTDWNLEMSIFVDGEKPEYQEKNPRSKARTNNKLNAHTKPSRYRTRATLVGGGRSHHCTNRTSPKGSLQE